LNSTGKKIDANPFIAVDSAIFESGNENIPSQVCRAIASYIGGDPQDIALTQNTTTGLALLYHGLPLREGDEILTTTHDHYGITSPFAWPPGVAERPGARFRFSIPTTRFAGRNRATRSQGNRTKNARCGCDMGALQQRCPPSIARIAESIADANRGREQNDRVLLIVDGVHGLGVEDPKITALGCDAFAAGTHKWMFGPRGTGFVWAKPAVWQKMRPVFRVSFARTFRSLEQEHAPQAPARAASFHRRLSGFRTLFCVAGSRSFSPGHRARSNHGAHTRVERSNEGGTCADAEYSALHTARRESFGRNGCFDVKGTKPQQVVKHLLDQRIVASTTPYRVSYARLRAASSILRRKSTRRFARSAI